MPSYYAEESSGLEHMNISDCRRWISDCACAVCRENKSASKNISSIFEDYNFITLQRKELTKYHYLLCPKEMPVFVFKTRTWGMLLFITCPMPRHCAIPSPQSTCLPHNRDCTPGKCVGARVRLPDDRQLSDGGIPYSDSQSFVQELYAGGQPWTTDERCGVVRRLRERERERSNLSPAWPARSGQDMHCW